MESTQEKPQGTNNISRNDQSITIKRQNARIGGLCSHIESLRAEIEALKGKVWEAETARKRAERQMQALIERNNQIQLAKVEQVDPTEHVQTVSEPCTADMFLKVGTRVGNTVLIRWGEHWNKTEWHPEPFSPIWVKENTLELDALPKND